MMVAMRQDGPSAARAETSTGPRPPFLAAGATDRGRFRPRNEDALRLCPELGLFLVADGVSGATGNEGGGLAAQLAVDTVARVVDAAAPELLGRVPTEVLRGAIQLADERIRDKGKTAGFPEMATTIAAVLVEGALVLVAHVGDSRVYRRRRGKLKRLTVDHNLLAEWKAVHGGPAPPEVRARGAHILTRALGGTKPGVEVDVRAVSWQPGDLFLLCSDGLHGLLDDGEMADVLAGEPDLERAVAALVELANDEGGYDNITALLVRMVGGSHPAEAGS